MPSFFDGVDPNVADELEQLSRLMYELRENHNSVLARYGTDDAGTLLARIRSGEISEHPAYDDYLSARILADTRETVRAALRDRVKEVSHT